MTKNWLEYDRKISQRRTILYQKLHFRTEKAYVRGLAGGAFRGRLILPDLREI